MPDRHDILLPFDTNASDTSELSPMMRKCARSLYKQAWTKYRNVDCPYGETDEAMLVWYTLHGRSSTPSLVTGKN